MNKFAKALKSTTLTSQRKDLNAIMDQQRSARNFGTVTLRKNTNQARGIAEFSIDFMKMDNKNIADEVYDKVRLFHTDSVLCGISAIAQKTNAPNILRDEAINRFSVNPEMK